MSSNLTEGTIAEEASEVYSGTGHVPVSLSLAEDEENVRFNRGVAQ